MLVHFRMSPGLGLECFDLIPIRNSLKDHVFVLVECVDCILKGKVLLRKANEHQSSIRVTSTRLRQRKGLLSSSGPSSQQMLQPRRGLVKPHRELLHIWEDPVNSRRSTACVFERRRTASNKARPWYE